MLGHWHPLVVHLPIGILLLAAIGEWWGSKNNPAVLSVLWRIGLVAALAACVSGWQQAQTLEAPRLNWHQWAAWTVTVLAAGACWLPGKRWWALACIAVLAPATYWGGTITHGADFLQPVLAVEHTELAAEALKSEELPPIKAPMPDPVAVQRLRNAGWVVAPLARDSAWLSVSAVAGPIPDSSWQLLSAISVQICRLYIHDVGLPDSAWSVLRALPHLTRLSLKGCRLGESPFAVAPQWNYLKVLNLSQSDVKAADLGGLTVLPRLERLYLYQCPLTESDWSALRKAMPAVAIDTGGYKVPLLPTDTAVKKYTY